ncbi:ThuA domain-containing protein [Qingrenia yutianensis]|uniref:ThuA domain-containing protein n=1 Tax=Qingrenia yutianensis TaxID=2763676 RepID=A0A926ISF7_9FIRM|nr:ThuA domain-containing protein [Qingrenia yutianensis]MBC8595485.1 ThuA domain-containing protein [Qingrenia yutianensis]
MINVTVWNEYKHERESELVAKIYPDGIHMAIKKMLGRNEEFNIRTATLDMPEHGLTDDVLDTTDVLIWWGHMAHNQVSEEVAEKVKQHVLDGMGLIVLHSGHLSKPFVKLMGTCCRSKWRENDETERIWVVEPAHPIASGLPEYIEIPQEETYGERFEIPTPDELVFISWFSGGEVFRSGCCYKRGLGKIFYFRSGHEGYPIYWREDITKILENAVYWAKPSHGPKPSLGHYDAIENVKDKFAGMDESLRKHTYIKD